MQLAAQVDRPDFAAVVGGEQFRGEAAEPGGEIADVAQEHECRAVVACGVYCLGQVDDHRPVGADEHVVFGQVAVHQAGAQHAHDLHHQHLVPGERLGCAEFQVVEPRCGVTGLVGHQLHQQHTLEEVVGRGHAHPCRGKPAQRVDLGMLPGLLLLLAPVTRALLHGAGAAAVLYPAAFGVLHCLAEAALVRLFVHFRAAHLAAAAHDVDHRFLAAHELAHDFVDEAFLDQRQQSCGGFHGGLSARLWRAMGAMGRGPILRQLARRPGLILHFRRPADRYRR